MKIEIFANTDLNQIISKLRKGEEEISLDAETLKFEDWIYEKLPKPLNGFNKIFDDAQEKDAATLTSITVLSGILQHYKTIYRKKEEGCQLYTLILADPSDGKGIAAQMRDTGMGYHKYLIEKYKREYNAYKQKLAEHKRNPEEIAEPIMPIRNFLFLPGDITKASMVKDLYANNGYGFIFLSELDTLVTSLRGEYGSFSEMLRQGFHGEHHDVSRKFEDPIEIDKLFLTLLASGTLKQLFSLNQSYDNGLSSRCIHYILAGNKPFESASAEQAYNALKNKIEEISKTFQHIGIKDKSFQKATYFNFTKLQQQEHEQIFKNAFNAFSEKYDKRLDGHIRRFGLVFKRICMLLTILFEVENENFYEGANLECSDLTFAIVKSMIGTLLTHLQIIDSKYEKHGNNKHILFSESPTNSTKQKYSVEEKKKIIKLVDMKVSYSKIGVEFGMSKGAISKLKTAFANGRLQFPETETLANSFNAPTIDVLQKLKEAEVSFFDNTIITKPDGKKYFLFNLLTKDAYKEIVEDYRSKNEVEKVEIKKTLCAYTVSGVFSFRADKNLLKHSGFVCIDIDKKDNLHVENFSKLKEEFSKILNVAFCAHSVSGEGYFLVIPIQNSKQHTQCYEAICEALKFLGINVDITCKNLSRLRFLSYDDKYYMAELAIMINQVLDRKEDQISILNIDRGNIKESNSTDNQERFLTLLEMIKEKGFDITNGYKEWFPIGCALANEFGEEGRKYFHLISVYSRKYNKIKLEKQFDACLKGKNDNGFTLATIFYLAKECGLNV